MDETGTRSGEERRVTESTDSENNERRKTKRRRQIDPTTCEREYNDAEIEFMHALDEYKRASGRMFPTCSEILEVFTGLGYRKVAEATDGFNFETDENHDTLSNEDDESLDSEFDDEASLERELEDQII
ncbi:MAG: hypothetical protein AAGA30_12375 [Planctomycetota bacterium]